MPGRTPPTIILAGCRTAAGALAAVALHQTLFATVVRAHGVAARDARFLQSIDGPAIVPLLYLGAKHMVTGYDHLLFLAGVVFFLYKPRHILLYVSLFTIGHSITLLAGALGGVRVNPFLIDAIIGLSIVYKGFENIGGFSRTLGWQPDPRVAVLVFGLFHGLGLATKLQDLALSKRGLVTNILSFNVGIELGQLLALTGVLIGLLWWRRHDSYERHAFAANTLLMAGGFILMGYQLTGYFVAPR
ncbi:MAG: HupE/UreJ family protein [Acidobacteriota bacterium]